MVETLSVIMYLDLIVDRDKDVGFQFVPWILPLAPIFGWIIEFALQQPLQPRASALQASEKKFLTSQIPGRNNPDTVMGENVNVARWLTCIAKLARKVDKRPQKSHSTLI